jgi:hypothetical protein
MDARSKFIHYPNFNTYKVPNEADMLAAIAELRAPNAPPIAYVAEKYNNVTSCFFVTGISPGTCIIDMGYFYSLASGPLGVPSRWIHYEFKTSIVATVPKT